MIRPFGTRWIFNDSWRDKVLAGPGVRIARIAAAVVLTFQVLPSFGLESGAVTECDRLAASPSDPTKPAGVAGVKFAEVDGEAAWSACSAALRTTPDTARIIFQTGRGASARKDYAQAFDLYRRASEQGHAGAMNNLGLLYKYGNGVAQDYAEARKWFENAAALDNPEAALNLAYLHADGNGTAQDYVEARKWYEKAAAFDQRPAMFRLGLLYEFGRGIAQDYVEARKWYERAAALGDTRAMINIGELYESGKGVSPDVSEARKWYEKAAALGNPDAIFEVGRLNSR